MEVIRTISCLLRLLVLVDGSYLMNGVEFKLYDCRLLLVPLEKITDRN